MSTDKKSASKWKQEWVDRGMVKVVIPSEKNAPIRGCHNGTSFTVPVNREVEIPRVIYKIIRDAQNVVRQSEISTREFTSGAKKVN